MSKQKIWSDFNRLECGKTENIFAGTWSFNKRIEISSSVERTVLHCGSKLEENEANDADTFIIHYTAVCLHISTLPPFVSTRLNTNPVYVLKSLHFFATDILIQPQ